MSLIPKGGNDRIYTPASLAKRVVELHAPFGRCLEPCRGQGAFVDALRAQDGVSAVDWAEIDEGVDFLDPAFGEGQRWDFVITNPPWSKIRCFLQKAMAVSDRVIFLCLINAVFMKARLRDIHAAQFQITRITQLDTPREWPSTGMALGTIRLERITGRSNGSLIFDRLVDHK